jgi:(E)-4-hydroxy-3-methyl-but-2-enyl pyrophosphate reductase (IPP and DMAPP forming)
MGVRRAVELAQRESAKADSRVFTLGPLIHNPQAVAQLEAEGIHALAEDELDGRVAGASVVIRAHGVPPQLRERLVRLGASIVDATCPRVLASQRKAARFAEAGYAVVIAGDRGHGEVTGIAGYAIGPDGASAAVVVGGPEEAQTAQLPPGTKRRAQGGESGGEPKVALIAQTTIKREEYEAIREALQRRFPRLEAVDSICPCTDERLAALAELAARVEAVVVVGGRNSANTARLYASAAALRPAWLVETAEELPPEIFGFAAVGLTAGASTPDSLIDSVEAALQA